MDEREPPAGSSFLHEPRPRHGVRVGDRAPEVVTASIEIVPTGTVKYDGDPLDICVITEKGILHGDILLAAAPIGRLHMPGGNDTDDKIVAVLEGDVDLPGEALSR